MGRDENFSIYYMKNKGRVSKFLKLNKRVYPFITHLRLSMYFHSAVTYFAYAKSNGIFSANREFDGKAAVAKAS
jgi:hypothetical protein